MNKVYEYRIALSKVIRDLDEDPKHFVELECKKHNLTITEIAMRDLPVTSITELFNKWFNSFKKEVMGICLPTLDD